MSSPLREQKTTAEDGVPQAWFGLPVAVSGAIALVGSRNAAVNGSSIQGAVYGFTRIRGVWKQTQKLVASDGAVGDQFGTSVAIFGNTAVVTAPLAKVNGNAWQGAVYVFELSNGFWKQTQKLVAKTGAAFSTLGTATGLTSEYLFAGAGGVFNQGTYAPRRVHVFKFIPGKTGGKWIESQVLETPAPDDPISSFGTAIALSGKSALVGARASRVGNNLGQGMVYGYTESNGTWNLTDKLTGSDSGARDNFGNSVAMSGAVAIMGAPVAVINGVRLVYPMEEKAMRFFNLLGNKFFSLAFTWLLGQSVKDSLCGTKVLSRTHYQIIAANRAYFGDIDPFGDFDLLFGAARYNLKILDLPVRYRERKYGETNIQRWKHGMLLLRMVMLASRRIRFV